MDMNLVILSGKLATAAGLRTFESGSRLLRSLVTVRSDAPRRRVDVIPVTLWDPAEDHEIVGAGAGDRVWVVGTVQRRFWSSDEGRRSRLEVVAHHMQRESAEIVAETGTGESGAESHVQLVE